MQHETSRSDTDADLKKNRVRVWLRLLQSTRTLETELNKRLRDKFSMSVARFDVLFALARNPAGLKMTALSSKLLITKGNATGIIERLVADGLVERLRPDENADRRAVVVRLTAEGKAEFEAFAEMHDTSVNQMLSRLGDEDLRTLLSLFDKMGLATRGRHQA